jgi:hypothetical protein
MKKAIICFFVLALAITLSGPALVAAKSDIGEKGLKGLKGQAGSSKNAFIELWEKDSETWEINTDGAWGKLKYDLSGSTFNFLFNGHGLEPDTDYTLIYYPDPWPGSGLISLGTATANEEGNIHISGSVDTGDLPTESDENDGAKIWLVLSSDIGEGEMTDWNQSEYLFEYDLIFFDDTDDDVTTASSASADKPDKPGKKNKPDKSNKGGNSQE